MSDDYPRSTARIAGHPIHPMLIPFPIVCYVGTLATDIAYWRTAEIMWGDFADWLVTAGVFFTVLAALAGLTDFFGERRIRALPEAWIHGLGNVAVLVLGILDALVHTRDAYTSVVPLGLILSGLIVLILLVTGWNGWAMVYRHGVALRPERRR
jgi:uncharacterized membrane protein